MPFVSFESVYNYGEKQVSFSKLKLQSKMNDDLDV